MRAAKAMTVLGILAMSFVLVYAFTRGDFFVEGSQLMNMSWGIVSLVDLYTGFMLFSAWIIYREKSLVAALVWTAAVMVLGFFAASVYAFIALQTCRNDWRKFWMGKNG